MTCIYHYWLRCHHGSFTQTFAYLVYHSARARPLLAYSIALALDMYFQSIISCHYNKFQYIISNFTQKSSQSKLHLTFTHQNSYSASAPRVEIDLAHILYSIWVGWMRSFTVLALSTLRWTLISDDVIVSPTATTSSNTLVSLICSSPFDNKYTKWQLVSKATKWQHWFPAVSSTRQDYGFSLDLWYQ